MKVIYFLFLSFIFFNTNVLAQKVTYSYVFRIQEITSYAEAKPSYDYIRAKFNNLGSFSNVLHFDNKELFFKITSQFFVSESDFREYIASRGLTLREFDYIEIKG